MSTQTIIQGDCLEVCYGIIGTWQRAYFQIQKNELKRFLRLLKRASIFIVKYAALLFGGNNTQSKMAIVVSVQGNVMPSCNGVVQGVMISKRNVETPDARKHTCIHEINKIVFGATLLNIKSGAREFLSEITILVRSARNVVSILRRIISNHSRYSLNCDLKYLTA